MSLDDVKRIGRPTGATVNDVALAALAGALRDSPGRPRQPRRGDPRVHAVQPAPAGRADPARARQPVRPRLLDVADRRPGSPRATGVRAATHDRDQALGRGPRRVRRAVRDGDSRRAATQRLSIDFFSAKATVVVSNMVGPDKPIRLAGVTVKGMLIMAPRSGSVGLGVTIFSYNGRVTIGVNADAGLVTRPVRAAARDRRRAARAAAPCSRAVPSVARVGCRTSGALPSGGRPILMDEPAEPLHTHTPACTRRASSTERIPGQFGPARVHGGASWPKCARVDSNHHGEISPQGPQPCASTNSATGAEGASIAPRRRGRPRPGAPRALHPSRRGATVRTHVRFRPQPIGTGSPQTWI